MAASIPTLSACSVVTADVDDLERVQLSSYQNVTLQLRSMGIHRHESFEARIVKDREGSNNDTLLQRVVRSPLGQDDEDIDITGCIPRDSASRIDFFVDHNDAPGYQAESAVGVDHSWSIPLSESISNPADGVAVTRDPFTGHWTVLFEHQFEFSTLTSVAVGLDDFKMVFSNLAAIDGAPISVRLLFNGRVIGRHRTLPDHPLIQQQWLSQPAVLIPNIVDTTFNPDEYVVEVYVDSNRNGEYDNPAEGGDRGWRITDLNFDDVEGMGMVVHHDFEKEGGNIDVGR